MTLTPQTFMDPLEEAVPMTDHDPDLCARVARVMGAIDDPNRAGHPEEYQIVWPDGRIQTCLHVGDPLHWWSPDTDPADAWRVLEYALSHSKLRNAVLNALRELTTEVPHGATINGHAIRSAIMNAVAAMEQRKND